MTDTNNCLVCKYIRWYLLIGLPILFFIWTRPNLPILEGISLVNILAFFIVTGLLVTVIWKYINEHKR
jgi:hypothetical protein